MNWIMICIFLCSVSLLQAKPLDSEDMKKFMMKAFEIYQQMDGMDEQESYNFLDSFKKVPMATVWIESEPDIDSGERDNVDQIEQMDNTKTLMQIGWQIAKMLFKKLMQMFA